MSANDRGRAPVGTKTVAPARPDDAEAVLQMWHAHQVSVLGRPDAVLEDVRDVLCEPDLDPGSIVVRDDEGQVLGAALVIGTGGRVDLDVAVDPTRGADLLPELLGRALDVLVAGARRRGHEMVHADQGCYRQDRATAGRLRAAGFEVATTFHRMRRELAEPVEVRLPGGLTVERVDEESDQALHRAYLLHTSTFAGHFGVDVRAFPEWLAALRARSGTGPLWFALLDGEDVGFLHETDQYVEDEDAGYVWRLGVEERVRGRGVGKALLLSSFAAMRGCGRSAALLHVDSANATGATRLYESVGMSSVLVLDMWRCTLALG